jgi:hypothetical protein
MEARVPGAGSTAFGYVTFHQGRVPVKRWHPDLVQIGSPQHAEATQMAKAINEAYAAIKGAPLRYYAGAVSLTQANMQGTRPIAPADSTVKRHAPPKTDWLEFWVRFVCGFLFGGLVGIRLWIEFLDNFGGFVAADLAVGCGLAAARYGDKFWYSVFGRWWMWG